MIISLRFRIAFILSFSISILSAQVTVKNEKKIETKMDLIYSEPHLAVNPADNNHLLVGTMYFNPANEKDYGCMSMTSKDNGKTWSFFKFPVVEGADPWCEFTANGDAVFSVLGLDSLYVYHSKDGGFNWNKESVNLGDGHDHETMVIDSTGGSFNGAVYLTSVKRGTVFLGRSQDNGKSFGFTNTFRFSNLNTNVMNPVILSNGTVVIPFNTFQRKAIGKNAWLDKSLSWMITSKDGGVTFSTPSFISQTGGKGFPTMAVDLSHSKFRDRLYWATSSEKDKMIYIHYSPDKGQSWSEPLPIRKFVTKDQPPRSPFTGVPTIAVNKNGTVGVIWQDRLEDTSGACQFLYFAYSKDGGEKFSEPVKVSSERSCPELHGNGWVGTRWRSGGDYLGLVPLLNGNFKAVWADSRSGKFQLFTGDIVMNE